MRWALELRAGGRGAEGTEGARSRLVDVSNLILVTVEKSRTFGEDIVLVGLR